MNRKAKMKRYIDALAFAIYEMVLYLDTHPDCRRGQESFNTLKRRYKEAVEAYEAEFGPLVRNFMDANPNGKWEWIKGPWPWENKEGN